MFNFYTVSITALSIASLVFSSNVFAAPTCLDNNNIVCITETYDETLSAERGKDTTRYSIINNSDTRIFAFAVSNSDAANAFIETNFTGWEAKTLNEGSWNAGSYVSFSSNSSNQTWLTGTFGNGYTALGSYASLLGETAETNANLYWNSGNDNALTTGLSFDAFLFDGLPASNFVAFDQNGSVIASSLTTSIGNNPSPVPEPSEYAMLIVGIALIHLTTRKKYSH